MISCQDYKRLRELQTHSPQEQRDIEEHTKNCHACQAEDLTHRFFSSMSKAAKDPATRYALFDLIP